MSDNKSKPARRGGWRRKLLWSGGIVLALVIILYFVATSSAFFKGFILPRVGAALNADVTVSAAEISPFHQVRLLDLKVLPHGGEPLLAVHEVRASYSLMSILGGKIVVSEVVIDSPLITLVKNADGSSNLDPLLRAGAEKETTKNAPKPKSSKPAQVDIKLVSLANATVRITQKHADGSSDVTEVSGVEFKAQDIKNGTAGKLDLAAKLALDQAAQTNAPASGMRATVGGSYTFNLMPDLMPSSVQGNLTFAVDQASGGLADLSALTAQLDCEASPTEVKQLALRFAKDGKALGEVLVSGPLDSAKQEGKLKLEVKSLDRQVLNLAGAASGLDFGTTTINSSADIELASGGQKISLSGNVKVASLQFIRANETSPTLDLNCDYAVAVDKVAESATLETLNVTGTQGRSPLLTGGLSGPMTIGWGGNSNSATGDSTLDFTVAGLNLADWKIFTGPAETKGTVSGELKLLAQAGGSKLALDLGGQVDKFSAMAGTNRLEPSDIRLQAHARATDLKQFALEDYKLEILNRDQSALSVSGSGTFDQATKAANLKLAVQAALKPLMALQPKSPAADGALTFTAEVTSQNRNTGVSGGLSLKGLTGELGGSHFTNYETALSFDVGMKEDEVTIRQISGQVVNDQNAAGKFEATGKFNPFKLTGQVDAKLTDINQNTLMPFVAAALGDKKLVSVAINSTVSVGLDADSATGIKADLSVTNLVVNDPTNTAPVTPLELRAQVDTTVKGQTAEFRECELTFTPTERAKNQLDLTGNVDFSRSNAITGQLKLAGDALDLTRYYDLFAPKSQPAPTTPTPAKPAAAASSPAMTNAAPAVAQTEPAAMTLPLQNFNLEVAIGRIYLREVDISKLDIATKIDGGKIVVQPCQLTLNDGAINAGVNLDLGTPGYVYDVNLDMQGVPLAPLMDSFAPERKGQLGGQLTASATLKGAGVTDANVKKNLAGQFDVVATNLNYSIADVRSPTVNRIIDVIVGLPDLIRGGSSTGSGQRSGSDWANQLTAQPIEVMLAHGTAGAGEVNVKQVEVRSAAFRVDITGNIELADIRTNSTIHFPISVALGRTNADQIGLVNASTPASLQYIALPDFLTINGTLGTPKTDLSKSGLTVLAAKTVGGIGKQVGVATGSEAKSLYKTVDGWFKSKPATNAPAATATTATNTNAEPKKKSGVLNWFKKSKEQ